MRAKICDFLKVFFLFFPPSGIVDLSSTQMSAKFLPGKRDSMGLPGAHLGHVFPPFLLMRCDFAVEA